MDKKNNRPKVYNYVDHVQYMNDMVEFLKKESKVFSFRYFAKKSGFASQSALKFFLDGKRNLTAESIQKVAKGFQLDSTETKYFENLVKLNQESSNERKNEYFQEMLKVQKKKKIRMISTDQYDYFSKWYNPAIRELIRCKDFQGDPKWIVSRIFPMISVPEARESLRLLERLGLIQKDVSGKYVQTDRAVTTERELSVDVRQKFSS
ncbi:MAG: TIGR02147 family protein [Bdellovibrionota bacterium]